MESTQSGRTQFKRQCVVCGTTHEFDVDTQKYNRWYMGEKIQNVWPELPPEEREMMISGTCSHCFDFLFPPE